jgi:thioredoxin-like negative regulator of GroEL
MVFFKPIWEFIQKLLGIEKKENVKEKSYCKDGVCSIDNKDNNKGDKDNENKDNGYEFIFPTINGEINLTENMNFDLEISNTTKPIIVRFSAEWCKPCKKIHPDFIKISNEHNESAIFVAVDVDTHDELAAKYSALSIPLFVAIKDGKEIARYAGSDVSKLNTFINSNLLKDN